MAYKVELAQKAQKWLETADATVRERLIHGLRQKLAVNPVLHGKRLRGKYAGLWRFRVGKYRAIYEIQNEVLVILVLEIDSRGQIYD